MSKYNWLLPLLTVVLSGLNSVQHTVTNPVVLSAVIGVTAIVHYWLDPNKNKAKP